MAWNRMNDVQALVDALAVELGRPVGLDDRRFRALAYSSHLDDVDDVRRSSILRREAPQAVTEWLESLGVADASHAVRVPANREHHMAARVCVPVRFHETLLGYLWLIDEPEAVTDADEEAALRCAAELAAEIFRTRRLENEERAHEAELAQRLLVGPDQPAAAAAELLTGLLTAGGAFVALVLQPRGIDPGVSGGAVRVRLAAALEQTRRTVPPRHFLTCASSEQASAVVVLNGDDPGRRAHALLAAAEDQFADRPDWSAVVGIGGMRSQLVDVRASYAEAQSALRVGLRVPGFGPLVAWSELGAYRTITTLIGSSDPAEVLPDHMRHLLQMPDAAMLVTTLESYLENGCDAQAAAAVLLIHRSTLYHRLHRVEEIAGLQLRNGDDRLALHLGLRIWRLAGSPPALDAAS